MLGEGYTRCLFGHRHRDGIALGCEETVRTIEATGPGLRGDGCIERRECAMGGILRSPWTQDRGEQLRAGAGSVPLEIGDGVTGMTGDAHDRRSSRVQPALQ